MKETRSDACKRMLDAIGYVGDELIESAGKHRKTYKHAPFYALLTAGILLLLIAVPSAIRSGNVEPYGTEDDPYMSDWDETPALSGIVSDPPATNDFPPFYETTNRFETTWMPMTTAGPSESMTPPEETSDTCEISDETDGMLSPDESTDLDLWEYTKRE